MYSCMLSSLLGNVKLFLCVLLRDRLAFHLCCLLLLLGILFVLACLVELVLCFRSCFAVTLFLSLRLFCFCFSLILFSISSRCFGTRRLLCNLCLFCRLLQVLFCLVSNHRGRCCDCISWWCNLCFNLCVFICFLSLLLLGNLLLFVSL